MKIKIRGKVMQLVKITNVLQVLAAENGWLSAQDVKSIEIEMLVDTGAAMVCLPKRMIEELGLKKRAKNMHKLPMEMF